MMRMHPVSFVWGFSVLAACHRGSTITVIPPAPQTLAPILADARVYYGDGPAYRDSVRLIVRDQTAWRHVWAQATSTQPSSPSLPAIDFGREMVILVGAGRMNPGDEIHVDSAGVRGGYFVIVIRTITDCRNFPAEVYPLEIVRVAWSDKPATFAERRERAAHCQ